MLPKRDKTAFTARDFGHGLRSAIELASVSTPLGIDAGRDLATSGLARAVKDQIAKETETLARDNVHGLDVFEDDPNVRVFNLNATGTVHAMPAASVHGAISARLLDCAFT